MRKVTLLRKVATTRLENCASLEDYVCQILDTADQLACIGMNLNTELVGALMLAGLPPQYEPLTLPLEGSGHSVTSDLVKTKLLQHVKSQDVSAEAAEGFYTQPNYKAGVNSENKGNENFHVKKIRCFNCNKMGHVSKNCRAKRKRANVNTVESEQLEDKEDAEATCAFLSQSLSTQES
ncbi:uncharacterized protein LOC106643492 [Copidosoma floridanum]|uniref:uncharacterized protein LOC106643492 n=1 Tax=Copidosoma floridanum TaxID=29053 RepID=UPI0006C9C842|nr:uncharacterized protein LOC106643492 [Copidosoma floridanum]